MTVTTDIEARRAALDWRAIEQSLWEWGYAKTPPVLTPAECTELIALYADDRRFRSRVEMARYKFGVGDYQYFDAPRSDEHTSELQSQSNIVCRLLLEKNITVTVLLGHRPFEPDRKAVS